MDIPRTSPIHQPRVPANQPGRDIKVCLVCTGVGIMNRGIESFFRECFDGLRGTPGLALELLKGRGPEGPDEHRVWCLGRDRITAKLVGVCVRRNSYVVEQLSSYFSVARHLSHSRPDIVYYSDMNLAMRLWRYRRRIGVPFRMIYSNGAPLHPPFTGTDHVHQVAPKYFQEALAAGEPAEKHSMVPYGIHVPEGPPATDLAARSQIRARLNLPPDRRIVLSVGWVSAYHKRMDYLIDEVASLPEPRPYLVLLGAIDAGSRDIVERGRDKLGLANFTVRSVPYEQVTQYYQAADAFTLASLKEGFGRVFLEALIHGLPCVVHDDPVMRFVLEEEGTFSDLSRPGALASALAALLAAPQDPQRKNRRRESVRRRFGWSVLAPAYRQMFQRCIDTVPLPF